ncbi:3'-5' exoribonuclease [Tsukamurella sp. PLM1]|uniref:3'-5' exoribonuclease n=1 Tax=Tsukamurella sp. PLM1 TaxID=2929795 RepID=UPI00206CF8C1|nr:3'-5' exoribonuclease [Tsukamurella sp. PLM1]BDH55290.1 3'-5' exoribonuclease [Tsukamurella sp. PLM1]
MALLRRRGGGGYPTGASARSAAPDGARYFYDTEFHWDGVSIRLISIAVVSDTGREFYEHSDQYDRKRAAADPFLAEYVLPGVTGMPRRSDAELRERLQEFFEPRPSSLWADFGAWDQIALMQIWGDMDRQPRWLPMATRNVREYAAVFGRSLPDYPAGHHDALIDARHVRTMFRLLEDRIDALERTPDARSPGPAPS